MIIVNASAAREGGALTILNSFCSSLEDDENYIILSPIKPKNILNYNNVKWIECNTYGIYTLLFSLFFVYYYVVKFRARKVISFSNFNVVFPVKKKITYFHQLLIFTSNRPRFILSRLILRFFFQSNSLFVVQTSYVRDLLLKCSPNCREVIILWPGISDILISDDKRIKRKYGGYDKVYIFPVHDIDSEHKNFSFLKSVHYIFQEENILLLLLTEKETGFSNFKSIGSKDRDEWLDILVDCDGIIVTSLFETLCLPIFESIVSGKVSLVLKADYLNGLFDMFDYIDNLIVFDDSESLKYALKKNPDINIDVSRYNKSKWSLN